MRTEKTNPSARPNSVLRRVLGWVTLIGLIQPVSSRAEVILHAFNWRYAEVAAEAATLAALGYDAVLVAPAYRSQGAAWWARYQPQDYRLIDHPLGNTEDFAAMVQALRAQGVAVYADLVFNHMANEAAQRADLNYPGSMLLQQYASQPAFSERQRLFGDLASNLFAAADFGPAICISDYNSVFQVQNYRLCGGGGDRGLPDLLGNQQIIAQQRAYVRALAELGVAGFRLDAAKHMTLDHINTLFADPLLNGRRVFGELITGGGAGNIEYQRFLAPYLQATAHAAYDFPLFFRLRAALGFGGSMRLLQDPEAAGQALPQDRAITFVVTHDIPNNAGFRGLLLDPVDETLGYAYLLGSGRGSALIYSDHNESGDQRWIDAYRRDDLVRMLGFNQAMRGLPMSILQVSDCHLLFTRGDRGLVGINKCGQATKLAVPLAGSGLRLQGAYSERVQGRASLRPRNGQLRLSLPARSAQMWQMVDK